MVEYVTKAEAARMIGVSRERIDQLLKKDKLQPYTIEGKSFCYVTVISINELLEIRKQSNESKENALKEIGILISKFSSLSKDDLKKNLEQIAKKLG